ncbi:hypothetical protein SPAN111604_11195 [Sphingomonas antarctica]|uniref:hypothetical protein n=1 Tax=Sphingomonas antarctica TaxID=2040274 RepID=UPI0039E99E07
MNRVALALPIILAACTPSGPPPPSLLPRAAEKVRIDDPPGETAGVVAAQASTATQADIVRLLAQADAGEAAQVKVYAANRAALGGLTAASGSEAYVAAQTALSALESARIPTLDALSELDRLALAAESSADAAALTAAQAKVQAILDRQDARLR